MIVAPLPPPPALLLGMTGVVPAGPLLRLGLAEESVGLALADAGFRLPLDDTDTGGPLGGGGDVLSLDDTGADGPLDNSVDGKPLADSDGGLPVFKVGFGCGESLVGGRVEAVGGSGCPPAPPSPKRWGGTALTVLKEATTAAITIINFMVKLVCKARIGKHVEH
jgi:hypothetical protein